MANASLLLGFIALLMSTPMNAVEAESPSASAPSEALLSSSTDVNPVTLASPSPPVSTLSVQSDSATFVSADSSGAHDSSAEAIAKNTVLPADSASECLPAEASLDGILLKTLILLLYHLLLFCLPQISLHLQMLPGNSKFQFNDNVYSLGLYMTHILYGKCLAASRFYCISDEYSGEHS